MCMYRRTASYWPINHIPCSIFRTLIIKEAGRIVCMYTSLYVLATHKSSQCTDWRYSSQSRDSSRMFIEENIKVYTYIHSLFVHGLCNHIIALFWPQLSLSLSLSQKGSVLAFVGQSGIWTIGAFDRRALTALLTHTHTHTRPVRAGHLGFAVLQWCGFWKITFVSISQKS